MIKLYQYPGIWEMPSLSPFCSKVFYFLIWAKIPFEVVHVSNPRKGPNGKFPVIEDNGLIVADSEFIIEYCRQKYEVDIEDRMDDIPIRRLLEEHLYFIILYSRWIDPETRMEIEKAFKPFFPRGMGKILLSIIRMQLHKQGYSQGISRHNRPQIYKKGIDDLRAVEQFIIHNQLEKCRVIDMSVYAFLQVVQQTPLDIPIRSYVTESESIQCYLSYRKNEFRY
jgi:hypothetical protein